MPRGNGLAEYVIRLGTEVDNSGVQQLLNLLDTTRMKALGVTAAFTAVTTAVYKFVAATAKQEFELKKLAKQQHKNELALNAQNKALNAMGMTLQEINKDKGLKTIYEDIKAFNEELRLPNVDGALSKVRELQGAFWKLKSAVNYAVQSIGRQVLINLEDPIKRITGYLNGASEWVKKELNSVTSRIASVITAFAKGVIGIGEVVGKIFNWIGQMPTKVKAIGAAIGIVFTLINSGPLGKILALVTLIGDIIHDYENYQWNKENGLSKGDEGYVANLNDKFGIWDAFSENGFLGLGQVVVEQINKAFEDIDAEELGKGAAGLIEKLFSQISSALTGEGDGGIFSGIITAGKTFGKKFFEFISTTLSELGDSDISTSIQSIITNIFGRIQSVLTGSLSLLIGKEGENGEYENGLLQFGVKIINSILDFIVKGAETVENAEFGTKIGSLISTIFKSIGDFLSKGSDDIKALPGNIFNSVTSIASSLLDFLIDGLNALLEPGEDGKTGIGSFVTGIFDFIKDSIHNLAERISSDPSAEGHIDISGTFATLGEQIGQAIGAAIKIGADFLTTFVQNALEWVTSGQFVEDLAKIGKAILDGILMGMGNIFDAIMTSIFGDSWKNVKQKQDVAQQVELMADEEGMVTKANGEKVKVDTAIQEIRNSRNAEDAAKMYGLENFTAFDTYRTTLLNELGIGGLTLDGNGNVIESGGNESPIAMIAKAYGLRYSDINNALEGTKANGAGFEMEENRDFASLAQNVAFATDEQSLLAALNELNAFVQENEIAAPIEISGAVAAAEKARQEMQAHADANPIIQPVVEQTVAGETGQAWGGRIGSEGHYTVGEDGPEYIIPITKPERAAQLIQQMFNEMGGSAVQGIMANMGLGQSGTNGANMNSLQSAIGGMTMANTYNINAPVNINVNSSGADAKEIGSSVYDLAERHLIKNVMGVYA